MPPHNTPHDLMEKFYEELVTPPRRAHGRDALCGLLGALVLMTMLLIATGALPFYDWET